MIVFLVMGVAGVLYRERAKDLGLGRRAAEGVVQLQARTIEREVELVTSFVLHVAEHPAIPEVLAGKSPEREAQPELLQLVDRVEIFSRVRLLDEVGRELLDIRTTEAGLLAVPADELQQEQDRYYFVDAWRLEPGDVFVSSFLLGKDGFRLARPLRPILRFTTPVRDSSGRKAGLFEVEYLGRGLLERVSRAGDQLAGWTALVNARGHYLESPDGARSWGFVFGMPPTFAAQHGEVWESIDSQEEGSLLLGDGLYVHRRVSVPRHPRLVRVDLDVRAVAFLPAAALYQSSSHTARILLVGGGLVGLALAGLAWRLAFVGTMRERHERQLAESRRGLRQLSARLMEAQEEERRNISRDLHDSLGQQATALVIELKRAARSSHGRATESEAIQRAIDAGEALLDAMHRIATRLRSSILEDLGLLAALQELCEEFEERFGITTELVLDFEDEDVPEPVARNVHRLVQEALTNVFKHAAVKEVAVQVREEDRILYVEVVDQGVGFDLARASSDRLGLLGMRERVEQLGGRFACVSAPGMGTRIEARIELVRSREEVE
jgi:signal transduction histidine kinase